MAPTVSFRLVAWTRSFAPLAPSTRKGEAPSGSASSTARASAPTRPAFTFLRACGDSASDVDSSTRLRSTASSTAAAVPAVRCISGGRSHGEVCSSALIISG